MTIKVGINGFGRMGRLVLRAAWSWPELEFVQINDPGGDAATFAHLLNFDSVHGRWNQEATSDRERLLIDGQSLRLTANKNIGETDWSGCDLVIEASGKFKSTELLNGYLEQGVKRVVVTAPVKEPNVLNVVMGVNDYLYDPEKHPIVTAASCTTNCLAPMVKVIHEAIGIRHGAFTTIHDITNTQSILDQPHKDLRRARACGMSLIPTTTGSATAIMEIYPELKGRLDGHAVRVPLANASMTDAQFELERKTTVDEVNDLFKNAAKAELHNIFGYEERPLVSIDYRSDNRSGVLDASFTRVVNNTLVKLYAWYDNEMGYATRTVELARKIALAGI
ncbi:ArsJ-associated glyceraldehyde-3-phosphate dehydrogenase [Motiliproteus sp. MSK22-1]|uniref:ArsJ-associated glyceraldehyde-3-phosphate dehydrogenase n=1 Tax=Motiliproteus sp. MSK22-1 TaxID=1897630 RepID=UPI000976288E|nr:ArsJ-associated glyceraldehyde-3-phosphate dehydrogenase [Motiliproteus sp. MSK22-1]OMH27982.1 type I glyceraldehyde-3-phosphate dehydrogenase [Motiliproteus sp. MSK22-1]